MLIHGKHIFPGDGAGGGDVRFFDAAPLPGQQLVGAFDAEIAHTVGVLHDQRVHRTGLQGVNRLDVRVERREPEVVGALHLLDSLRRAAEIARLQYDNGYTDYLTVLDAERQLFSAELSLANALRDRLNAVVSVCMALGGGWQDPNVKPSFPVADAEELVKAHDAAGQKASQPAAAPAKEQPAAKQ